MYFILLSLYLLILVLLIIVYQDLKQRTIHVALPVITFILALVINYFTFELSSTDALLNLAFIAFNIIVLIIYFSIKSKKIVNPIDTAIGLGDIVFFIAITPLFTLRPFVLFFIFGLVFSLLMHLIGNIVREIKTIPLAGYFAMFLVGYVVLRDIFKLIHYR